MIRLVINKTYPFLSDQQRIDTLSKLNEWDFDIHRYDNVAKHTKLDGEGYRFVRLIENEQRKRTFLRIYNDMEMMPSESQITASIMRLVEDLPIIGFASGQGERRSDGEDGRGYKMFVQQKTFRYSLINNGFEFKDVNLDTAVPDSIGILVIADLRNPLSTDEALNLHRYIDRGGNLLIAGEPARQELTNSITESLGISFLPGQLVQPAKEKPTDLILCKVNPMATRFSSYFDIVKKRHLILPMVSVSPMRVSTDRGFNVTTLFSTESSVWNELQTKDLIDQKASFDADQSEKALSYPTIVALSRNVSKKEQKIIVCADADWLSNAELGMNRLDISPANLPLAQGAFYWLSGGKAPVNVQPIASKDNRLMINQRQWKISSFLLKIIFPFTLIAIGVMIWFRRRRR